ncbi:hypothetical protein DSO57_1010774 [Entomophthora muscae]|uniref:Uncharacterized protein n=1 Tax=Entomophthora muscae TaxID=34485 RepID=A0ACC2UFB3_9FUNG|nr:hypothetical protein DSO57_1010774 [Entomophthora muscae]
MDSIIMIQVPSSNPLLFAAQTGNKLLTYPFQFCRYQGTALFNTGANQLLINKSFADLMKLPTTQSSIKKVIMADNRSTPVTHKTKPFRAQFGDVQTTISGPIILSCSETQHRHTMGNPNLRIGFVLSLG